MADKPNPYLFVSYAREDFERIRGVLESLSIELTLRNLPVDLWVDVDQLRPGESWQHAFTSALERSIGMLVFVSPAAMVSPTFQRNIEVTLGKPHSLVIPVMLEGLAPPPVLAGVQTVMLDDPFSRDGVAHAAALIANTLENHLRITPSSQAAVSSEEAPQLAAELARNLRAEGEPAPPDMQAGSVFVVHGHHAEALAKLESYLASVGVTPILLSRQDEIPQSLFQKFMAVATKARFAIVLLSADDYGASRVQYEAPGVAALALQFRARQNVILELGFFYGRLGWENVFVVQQAPDQVFPNFEHPSDLAGVVFDSMTEPAWQKKLSAKLLKAKFTLKAAS